MKSVNQLNVWGLLLVLVMWNLLAGCASISVSAAGGVSRSNASCVVSSSHQQQLQDPTSSPVTAGSFSSPATWPSLSDANSKLCWWPSERNYGCERLLMKANKEFRRKKLLSFSGCINEILSFFHKFLLFIQKLIESKISMIYWNKILSSGCMDRVFII
jgi:hypothetical protein